MDKKDLSYPNKEFHSSFPRYANSCILSDSRTIAPTNKLDDLSEKRLRFLLHFYQGLIIMLLMRKNCPQISHLSSMSFASLSNP